MQCLGKYKELAGERQMLAEGLDLLSAVTIVIVIFVFSFRQFSS